MFNAYRDLKHLPKEVWILAFSAVVNRMGTMVLPFLVLYLTKGEGLSPERAAAVLGLYGTGALFMGPISGALCDRFGPVRVMLVGLFGSAPVLMLYPFAHGLVEICAVTLVFSCFNEVYRPALLITCSEVVPAAQRKQGFALIRLAINLGMSIGPALGGFLVTFSFPSIFVVDSLTTLAGGCVLYWFFVKKHIGIEKLMKGAGKGSGIGFRAFQTALRDRRLYYFCLALIPVNIVFFQHESTVPLVIVRELHLEEWLYGMLFTVNTILIIFLEIPLNTRTNHWSHAKSMAWGSLLVTLGFFVMVFAKAAVPVVLTAVIWTFGEMILFPASSAYVSEISPEGKRGSYMGVYSAVFSLCFIIAPWLGTNLLQNFGSAVLWWSCLGLGLVSVALFARLKPEKSV